MMRIVLIGFMGSGKTTVSRLLSGRLEIPRLDTDEMIERAQGLRVSEIFAAQGEAAFRALETECLRGLAGGSALPRDGAARIPAEEASYVLSVGGGVPLRAENRALLREIGRVFFLEASPGAVYRRLKDDTTRPLLQGGAAQDKIARIERMEQERAEAYRAAAEEIVATDGRTPAQVADEIVRLLTKRDERAE